MWRVYDRNSIVGIRAGTILSKSLRVPFNALKYRGTVPMFPGDISR